MACAPKRTVLAFAYGRAVRCGTALPMGGDRPLLCMSEKSKSNQIKKNSLRRAGLCDCEVRRCEAPCITILPFPLRHEKIHDFMGVLDNDVRHAWRNAAV
mgnify:CR=1 FL=1